MQREGHDISKQLLDSALSGNGAAMRQIARALRPVIQREVGAVLSNSGGTHKGRTFSQDVDDFAQEVWVNMFANDARELRRWEPERGSLLVFVRGIAFCDAISLLRNKKRSPYTEDPTELEDFDPIPESDPGPERETISRDLLLRLIDAVRDKLGVRGTAVFELLVLREQPVEEVCGALQMTQDAVHAWRYRLIKLARKIHGELESE